MGNFFCSLFRKKRSFKELKEEWVYKNVNRWIYRYGEVVGGRINDSFFNHLHYPVSKKYSDEYYFVNDIVSRTFAEGFWKAYYLSKKGIGEFKYFRK